jgi:flagellar basal body-associated protein FliL
MKKLKGMGKKKLGMLAVGLLLVLFEGYSMATKPPPPKLKVKGTVYQLPSTFLINLAGGQYAKMDVALLLAPGQSSKAEAPASGGPPAGSSSGGGEKGSLNEEPLIRAIVTNVLTGDRSESLVEERGRVELARRILNQINQRTDVKVEAVLFPDLTVQ